MNAAFAIPFYFIVLLGLNFLGCNNSTQTRDVVASKPMQSFRIKRDAPSVESGIILYKVAYINEQYHILNKQILSFPNAITVQDFVINYKPYEMVSICIGDICFPLNKEMSMSSASFLPITGNSMRAHWPFLAADIQGWAKEVPLHKIIPRFGIVAYYPNGDWLANGFMDPILERVAKEGTTHD